MSEKEHFLTVSTGQFMPREAVSIGYSTPEGYEALFETEYLGVADELMAQGAIGYIVDVLDDNPIMIISPESPFMDDLDSLLGGLDA